MTKITGPLMSISAQGRFSNKIIFRDTKNGTIATRFHSPGSVNPSLPTAAQLAHRALYSDAVASWQALTAPQQAAYDLLAEPEHFSGWNYFLREFISAPSFVVYDNFNRPNEDPLSSPWVQVAGWNDYQLVSEMAIPSDPTGGGHGMFYDASFSDDQYSQVMLPVYTSNQPNGVAVRMTPGQDCYWFQGAPTNCRIWRILSGSAVQIADYSGGGFYSGITVRLDIVGDELTAYLDGTPVIIVTDSNIVSGKPGLFAWENDFSVDDFEAGDL